MGTARTSLADILNTAKVTPMPDSSREFFLAYPNGSRYSGLNIQVIVTQDDVFKNAIVAVRDGEGAMWLLKRWVGKVD